MAKYLVTGGAGFIGSNLVDRLIEDSHDVLIIDNLSTGKEENIHQDADFIEGDIGDFDTIEQIDGTGFEGIIHLAAQSSGAIGQQNPLKDMRSNVSSTVNLIHWAKINQIKRFIYASSMTVYGKGNESAVDESMPLNPTGYYGVGKAASEYYLNVARSDGLDPTCFRFYSVYGPKQNLGNLQQGILSIYMAYMLKNEILPITGSLERYRDLIFIDDVIDALCKALYSGFLPSFVYNLGTGKPTKVKDMISQLKTALNLPKNYPVKELDGDPHDIFGCIAKTDRIERELNWSFKTDLTTGIQKMVKWVNSLNKDD